eukprot:5812455-Amphidinium_carterae.1
MISFRAQSSSGRPQAPQGKFGAVCQTVWSFVVCAERSDDVLLKVMESFKRHFDPYRELQDYVLSLSGHVS